MMSTLVDNSVKQGKAAAKGAIRKAYDAFNKDSAFRSNPQMQERINATLQGMLRNAEQEARMNGNWEPLNALANLSESEIQGTLAYVRAVTGAGSPGTSPLQVEGATVESSRAPVAEQEVALTEEQREVARRFGPAYEAKLKKAVAEQQKYDDLEWKE
jgi:hypothetical protein